MKIKPILFSFLTFFAAVCFGQKEKTTINVSEYGKKVSVGITILNGFGIPVRYYRTPKQVFEGGLYIGNVAVKDANDNYTFPSYLMFGTGFTYFGDRFVKEKKRKTKIRANGVAVRLNYLTGDYASFLPSVGWAMATFKQKNKNRSFIFELGLNGVLPAKKSFRTTGAGLYLRCHWNFFL
jgi:hypothetical protein